MSVTRTQPGLQGMEHTPSSHRRADRVPGALTWSCSVWNIIHSVAPQTCLSHVLHMEGEIGLNFSKQFACVL